MSLQLRMQREVMLLNIEQQLSDITELKYQKEIKACSEKSLFCTDDGRDDDEHHNGDVEYPSQ